MPKMPVDVKAVLEAATEIDTARQMFLHVALFFDSGAPEELCVRVASAFRTTSPQAAVEVRDYTRAAATVRIGCDVGVLVAGDCPETGPMVKTLQADGVPAVVVTASPEAVMRLAEASGDALCEADVVGLNPAVDGGKFPPDDPLNCEPYPLTVDRESALMERLGQWFSATFRRKRLAFALAFPFVRKPLARDVVNLASVENAGVGLVPFIPGADMPLMTLNQSMMVLQIAAVYGMEVGQERWRELLAVLGAGFVGRTAARQLVGLVPVLGWAIRPGMALAMTQAMGRAAVLWFERETGGVYELPEGEDSGRLDEVRSALGSLLQRVEPYAEGTAMAACAVASETTQALSAAAKAVLPRARAAVGRMAEVAGPAAHAAAERVAPAAARAASAAIPGVRATVDEFCRRQGIDPEQFFSQMAEAFYARRGR